MPDLTWWCDRCGGPVERHHYTGFTDTEHEVGVEYGPYGRLLAVEQAAKDLAAAVAPLLDREVVSPFITAWEIDGFGTADGEDMHAALAEAHGKLAMLLREGDDA